MKIDIFNEFAESFVYQHFNVTEFIKDEKDFSENYLYVFPKNEKNVFLHFLEWTKREENTNIVDDIILNKKDFYIQLENEKKLFKLNFYYDDIFELDDIIFEENKHLFFEFKQFYLNFRKVLELNIALGFNKNFQHQQATNNKKFSMLKKFEDFKLNNKHLDNNLNEMIAKFIVHYFFNLDDKNLPKNIEFETLSSNSFNRRVFNQNEYYEVLFYLILDSCFNCVIYYDSDKLNEDNKELFCDKTKFLLCKEDFSYLNNLNLIDQNIKNVLLSSQTFQIMFAYFLLKSLIN